MRRNLSHLAILFVLVFVAPFLTGCGKDYVTGKSTLNFYSLKSDVKLGQHVMRRQLQALRKKKVKTDSAASAREYNRIRRISRQIARVSHIPNFPYEIHLANVDIVNAWCAPGGKIMVYTGLWKSRKGLVHKGNDNEVAAVLAHEIAHATARHVTERISGISTIGLIGDIASAVIAGAGSPSGSNLFREIFYQGMNIYVPSYSRKAESEADRIGLIYMAKAGYNPQAAVNLWDRAAKSKGDKTSIFASHPSSGKRAADLKALLPEAMEIYKQTQRGKKWGPSKHPETKKKS